MRIVSEDYGYTVDPSTVAEWHSLYSTVMVCISATIIKNVPEAVSFLKDGECSSAKAAVTAKQMRMVATELAKIAPDAAVWDLNDLNKQVPWKGKIAETVTSCANLYTTSEGENLLQEVMALLDYAAQNKLSVMIG